MSLTKNDLVDIRTVFNEAFEVLVSPRLDEIDKRFNDVDKRFNDVDKRFNDVDKRFNDVDERFSISDSKMLAMESSLKAQIEIESLASINHIRILTGKIDDLTSKVVGLQSDVTEIYDRLVRLEKNFSYLNKELAELPIQDQILKLHAAVVALARKKGVTLPR